jgi:hypothetical protein
MMTAIANAIFAMEGRRGLPMGRPTSTRAEGMVFVPAHRLPQEMQARLGGAHVHARQPGSRQGPRDYIGGPLVGQREELFPQLPAPVRVPVMRPPAGRPRPTAAAEQAAWHRMRAAEQLHAAELAAAEAVAMQAAWEAAATAATEPVDLTGADRAVEPVLPLMLMAPDPELQPLPPNIEEALAVAYELAAIAAAEAAEATTEAAATAICCDGEAPGLAPAEGTATAAPVQPPAAPPATDAPAAPAGGIAAPPPAAEEAATPAAEEAARPAAEEAARPAAEEAATPAGPPAGPPPPVGPAAPPAGPTGPARPAFFETRNPPPHTQMGHALMAHCC